MKKSKLVKILSVLLVLTLLLGTISVAPPKTVYADSNDRRQGFLDLMAGKNASDSTDIQAMTQEDLRVLGLYLSNYYVPFGTVLDGEHKDDVIEKAKVELKDVGFTDEMCDILLEYEFQASLDSATVLYTDTTAITEMCGKEPSNVDGNGVDSITMHLDDDGYLEVMGGAKTIDGKTYYPLNLLGYQMSNGINLYWIEDVNGVEKVHNLGVLYDSVKTLAFNASYGENYKSTLDLTNSRIIKDNSACQAGDSDNPLLGNYGNCYFELGGLGDSKNSSSKTEDWVNSFSDSELHSKATFLQKVYIDWVGNIIVDKGGYRVVVLPASMNPVVLRDAEGTSSANAHSYSLQASFIRSVDLPSENACVTVYATNRHEEYTGRFDWDTAPGQLGGSDYFYSTLLPKYGITACENWDGALFDSNNEVVRIQQKGGNISDWVYDDKKAFVVYESIKNNSIDETDGSFQFETSADIIGQSTITGKYNSDSDACYWFSYDVSKVNKNKKSSLLLTYTFMYVNEVKGIDGYPLKTNLAELPQVTGAIDWGEIAEEAQSNQMAEETMSFIYGLLHPDKGIKYASTLLKNKLGGVFVGWHEDIVGSSDSNSTTGMTRYLGTSGYVTVPSLSDVEWIAKLVEAYDSIIIFMIIVFAIIMMCYIVTGNLTIQRGILGLFMFSALAFLPPVAIDTSVELVNKTNDTIFSRKFDYWAICQMETYLDQYNTVTNATTTSEYVSALLSLDSNGDNETGYSGVRLKWMSPKRYNEYKEVTDEVDNVTDGTGLSSAFVGTVTNAVASANSSEQFTTSGNLYLYRDYADIYRHASISYNLFSTFNKGEDFNSLDTLWIDCSMYSGSTDMKNKRLYGDVMKNSYIGQLELSNGITYAQLIKVNHADYHSSCTEDAIKDTSSLTAVDNGFLYDTYSSRAKTTRSYFSNMNCATGILINWTSIGATRNSYDALSLCVRDAEDIVRTTDIDLSDTMTELKYWGIEPDKLQMNLNDMIVMEKDELEPEEGLGFTDLSYFYFSLYAESPFYYFNNNTRDQFVNANVGYKYNYNSLSSSKDSFKELMLKDNQSYFYNYVDNDGYGELRDYMNMHDFFYYIIPAMRSGNEVVKVFEDRFGLTTYDTCSLRVKSDGYVYYNGEKYNTIDEVIESNWEDLNEQERYELWHDWSVNCIYNMYVPWLDAMEDCGYADAEEIPIAGKTYTVLDPLDPTSYFEMDSNGNIVSGRYMIFSRSEMAYYGLKESDLTEVERKIIEVQDNVYNETLSLMNYYTFSDETLIQAYTTIQLFEFNKVFSQESIVGKNYIQYPQGYELKAFTYDAYMRLIIEQASNEGLMYNNDKGANVSIYERVQKKTSLFFGITLVANDFVATYVIPGLRLFFIIAIFIISLALIIASAVKLEMNIVTVLWKSVLAPLLSFALVSIGLGFGVSLFMANGAGDGVVQTAPVIDLGDPTMAVLVMLIMNVVVTYLYFKICKKSFEDMKKYVKAVGTSVAGAVAGGFSTMVGAIAGGRRFSGFNRSSNTVNIGGGSGSGGSGSGSGDGGGVGGSAESRGSKNTAKTATAVAAGMMMNEAMDNSRPSSDYDGKAGVGDIRDFDKESAMSDIASKEKEAYTNYQKGYEQRATDYAKSGGSKSEQKRNALRDAYANQKEFGGEARYQELRKAKGMSVEEKAEFKALKSQRRENIENNKKLIKGAGGRTGLGSKLDQVELSYTSKKDAQKLAGRKATYGNLEAKRSKDDFTLKAERKAVMRKDLARKNAINRDKELAGIVADRINKQNYNAMDNRAKRRVNKAKAKAQKSGKK